MIVQVTILLLCAVGLYASTFMLRKARRSERGELSEPSVVQTGRARMFGIPNAAFGVAYYAALAIATGLFGIPAVWWLAFVAAALAAAGSVYLAYSLLFVTRMPCVYCWTSHVVNWALLIAVVLARPNI